MADPVTVAIAAALVLADEERVLLTWNDKWQAFTLPMTRLAAIPPGGTPERAGLRAASEVLQLPTRLIPDRSGKATRMLQLSWRDKIIKNYVFNVFPIEVHPDFQSLQLRNGSAIWMPVEQLRSGEYQPMSPTVVPVLNECREWGWL